MKFEKGDAWILIEQATSVDQTDAVLILTASECLNRNDFPPIFQEQASTEAQRTSLISAINKWAEENGFERTA